MSAKWSDQTIIGSKRGDRLGGIDGSTGESKQFVHETISRLQSAAQTYDFSKTYEFGDFVSRNGILYHSTNVSTIGPESFNLDNWGLFSGTDNEIKVKLDEDLPTAITGSYSAVADNTSGNPRFTQTSHGFQSQNQIEITNSDDPGGQYNGFNSVTVIDANTYDILALSFNGDAIGNTERFMRPGTKYLLEAPVTASFGFAQQAGTNNEFESTNTFTNTLTYNGTTPLFKGGGIGSVLQLTELSVVGSPPATTMGILFDRDGTGVSSSFSFMQMTNCQFQFINDLGTLKNMVTLADNVTFAAYNVGLVCENAPFRSTTTSPISTGNGSVFISIKNLLPTGVATIFSGLEPTLAAATDTVFDIDAATPTANRVTIVDSGPAFPGKYFKAGTEEIGTITAFADGGPDLVTVTADNTLTGATETVFITNSVQYNGEFEISSRTLNDFDISVVGTFIADTPSASTQYTQINTIASMAASTLAGTVDSIALSSEPLKVTITDTANNLVNGFSVDISGTTNYNGTFIVSNVTTNTFDIIHADDGNQSGTWIVTTNTASTITTTNPHGKSTGDSLFIDKTISYDGGFQIANATGSVFDINTKFVASESNGVWRDGSLRPRDLPVVLQDVQGEADSFSKAGYFTNLNAVSTTIGAIDTWIPLNLGSVQESSLNQRWRLTNSTTGEIKLTSEEPFLGTLFSTLLIKRDSGGGNQNYKLRAAKNGGPMIDRQEYSLDNLGTTDIETSTNFDLSVQTDDLVRLEIFQIGGSAADVLVTRISTTTVNQ